MIIIDVHHRAIATDWREIQAHLQTGTQAAQNFATAIELQVRHALTTSRTSLEAQRKPVQDSATELTAIDAEIAEVDTELGQW